ncbi:MAG: helix-turn-helix domain-containing protein [Bacteroidetes bacterium]|nr:helix-turn-helix domain-containing protein [Bacteroidota bacterium]
MQKESVLQIMTDVRNLLLLQKEVFTIDEACSYTRYEKSYIYKLCSAKAIPHYKSPGGKAVFFKKDEIIDWMTSNPVKTKQDLNKAANNLLKSNKNK